MATGDRGVARRVKPGGFGAVSLGFATEAPLPRERDLRFAPRSAGSFTLGILGTLEHFRHSKGDSVSRLFMQDSGISAICKCVR